MQKFVDYLREAGAAKATVVAGPNGKFITVLYKEGYSGKTTFPIGKNSQNGMLEEFNVLKTDDGAIIATINEYEDLEVMTF